MNGGFPAYNTRNSTVFHNTIGENSNSKNDGYRLTPQSKLASSALIANNSEISESANITDKKPLSTPSKGKINASKINKFKNRA